MSDPKLAWWILFPGLTMSLGWGLRGYIGGGPLGAMIPGAMVAMSLCMLLRRRLRDSAFVDNGVVAAFGAVGVGFGGQMTYGQTIGLTMQPDTAAWGLLGLTLKGAIWGLLGGAVIATGLVLRTVPRAAILRASLALMAACALGWKLVNEPRLIYFSDPVNKPRAEIWAGLLLAAVAWLLVLRNRTVTDFSWISALGGGIGFGFGGWLNALGRTSGWHTPVDWWKLMEFTFGFLFGAALGYAAWLWRDRLETDASTGIPPSSAADSPLLFALLLPLCPLSVAAEEYLGFRFTYTAVGAVLLVLCQLFPRFAWQTAITTTAIAFSLDFLQSRPGWVQWPLWLYVAVVGVAAGFAVDRNRERLPWLLLLLTWLSVADSHAKSWLPPFVWDPPKSYAHAHVEIAFTAMAIAVSWMLFRLREAERPASAQERS